MKRAILPLPLRFFRLALAVFMLFMVLAPAVAYYGTGRAIGGGIAGGGGGATPTFGPTLGRDTTIANSGPRTVAAPGGSPVQITTADNANFNTILSSNPGATFYIRAGTYARTSTITPLSNQTLVFEAGAILDGNSGNFGPAINLNNISGVTIRGGLIREIGSDATSNHGRGILIGGASGQSHTIEDVEVTSCFLKGIAVQCLQDVTIQYCYMHDNGEYATGVNGNTVGAAGTNNVLIYRCESANNNSNHNDPAGDGGFAKFIDARNHGLNNLRVLENYIHNEYGWGPWVDNGEPNTTGITISENVVEDCLHAGIFYEVGGGGAVISRNYLKGNGGGDATFQKSLFNRWQILVSCSDGSLGVGTGILIERNDLDSTLDANFAKLLGLIDFTRGEGTHVKKVTVNLNRFYFRVTSAQAGGYDTNATHVLNLEATNTWTNNEYHSVNFSDNNWKWPSVASDFVDENFTTWKTHGFDASGTQTDEL